MFTDTLSILKKYFDLASVGTSVQELMINIFILAAMNFLLSVVYVKTAKTLSNRKRLAAIFPLLSIITMMIISVIKSSLALSLGLVGALSIVRFRSAIKEPEELTYIFFAISLGLGMGADQQALTLVFFLIVCAYIFIKHLLESRFSILNYKTDQSLYITINFSDKKITLDKVIEVLNEYCHFIDLKRVDNHSAENEFLFVIKARDYHQLTELQAHLKTLDKTMKISLLNDEQLFA